MASLTMKKIKLEDIAHKVPFETPTDYFEQLPAQIQSRVHEHTAEKERFSVSWSWRRTAIASVAASVIGILLWVTYPQKQHDLDEESLSKVNNEEIFNYLNDSYITQQELSGEAQKLQISSDTEEAIIQELNIDDDDLKKAIEEQDFQEDI